MRIVFVNLHGNEMLIKTADKFVFKHSCAIKHKYLLHYLLLHPEYEVCSYINDRGFSLMHNGPEKVLNFLNLFRYIEHKKILKKNSIDVKKIKVIKKWTDIKEKDIVILYRHNSEQFRYMENVNALKIVSMIHFWGKQSEAKLFEKAKIEYLMNESNLEKNSEIFRKFYLSKYHWIVHPFVFEERFKNITKFSERKNMAFATGTITYKDDPDFLSVYHDSCDQPSRKQIKDNPEYFKDTIECYCSDYNEDATVRKEEKEDNKLVKFYKKLYNRIHSGQQKKYYSFDMVEKFNEYKMCIVGEEILGVPGIGFVEGMACGAAYIGLDSPMYTDLGLYPGIHYIAYNGTKEDLRAKIEYYQMNEHQKELEQIATTGCEYVRTHFNGNAVAEKLLNDIINQQNIWMRQKEGK